MITQVVDPVIHNNSRSGHAPTSYSEKYAALLLRLHKTSEDGSRRLTPSVGVTGVSTDASAVVALELATCAAQTLGEPVLLVQVVDRAPPRAEPSLVQGYGLAELLDGEATVEEAVHTTSQDSLSILLPGMASQNAKLYQPSSIRRIVQDLGLRFPFVVFELPPVEGPTACVAIAAELDSMLIVVEAEKEASSAVLRSTRRLQEAGANTVGVVLNQRPRSAFSLLRRRRR